LHPEPDRWELLVTLYTDIQDSAFIEGCKEAIENRWHVRSEGQEFRVKLSIKTLQPADLYPSGDIPKHGAHINVVRHVARFPKDGGVLTTGAQSTYAIPRRFVALAPAEISTTTIAHEFGHILGFVDYYFRGYRDLGKDGYKIIEVVPDHSDIMSAPGSGQVLRAHFEQILDGLRDAK